jgi:hypothetical protein
VSPIPFLFAIWGWRSLLDSRAQLAALLFVWSAPTLLFYFRATTTCRYFLNAMVPFAIAAAVAMPEVAGIAARWFRRQTAWAIVFGIMMMHLVIALGHVSPMQPLELFYGGTFTTHDGPMPTGALLARTYLTPGSFLRALPRPSFGTQSYPFWEGVAFNAAVAQLREAAPSRTVVVLLSGGFTHAFHYHMHVAHAQYDSGPSSSEELWQAPLWMRLGHSRVLSVGRETRSYEAMQQLDVKPGDLFWVLGGKPFPGADDVAKLPKSVELKATKTFDSHISTFEVIDREAAGR